jgi:integrase
MSLSDKTIRDAKPKSNVYRIRDSNVVCRGFGVTVAPSGAKSFFLSFTSPEDGKRKQIILGRYPATSLREARVIAAKTRALIDQGADPAVDKKREISGRIAKRELGTLDDLMNLYASDLETDGKRTAKEVRRITVKDIPPYLLTRPAHLITREDILDILTPIAQRGALVQADNTRSYLRAAFELGANAQSLTRWRGKTKSFEISINPVASVRKSQSVKPRGKRHLNPAEVRTLWFSDGLSPIMLLSLKLILTSGQRVEEVLGASWDEFDEKENIWTIPGPRRKTRHKTTEPHLVPLTRLHTDLLKDIRALSIPGPLLFPSNKIIGRVISARRHDSLNHSLSRFIEKKAMKKFSPRDLRRTFKTLGASFGLSLEIRNRLQGHAMTDVGSVYYDRHDYLLEKRDAMERWCSGLEKLLAGQPL